MWGWIILIVILLIVAPIILTRKKKKESYIDLDSRLSNVKSTWDKCCAKISQAFGI